MAVVLLVERVAMPWVFQPPVNIESRITCNDSGLLNDNYRIRELFRGSSIRS